MQFYADRNETSSCVVSQEFPSQTVDARARARVFARLVSKYHMALHARWSFMRSWGTQTHAPLTDARIVTGIYANVRVYQALPRGFSVFAFAARHQDASCRRNIRIRVYLPRMPSACEPRPGITDDGIVEATIAKSLTLPRVFERAACAFFFFFLQMHASTVARSRMNRVSYSRFCQLNRQKKGERERERL